MKKNYIHGTVTGRVPPGPELQDLRNRREVLLSRPVSEVIDGVWQADFASLERRILEILGR